MVGDLPKPLAKFLRCKRCGLHRSRFRVVVGEGSLPAKLLFIGEAPGKNEDLMGRPFIGPSGKLLRSAIEFATKRAGLDETPSMFISNVVACRPTDEKFGPNRPPKSDEVWACWRRLTKVFEVCKPERVVLLGKSAQEHCAELAPEALKLPHPAWILRMGSKESPEYRRFTRHLAEMMKSIGSRRRVLSLRPRKVIRKRRR